jgi:hypothetical protein
VNAETLFCIRYEQLIEILQGGKLSQLLDLSVILRQFLVDNFVSVANRNHKLKLSFEISDSTKDRLKELESIGIGKPALFYLGDVIPPKAPRTKVTADNFLKYEIVYYQDVHYSVLDVIKICSNRLGGIHFSSDTGDDAEETFLRDLNDNMILGGAPIVFRCLLLVARIAEEALKDLYHICKKSG